MSKKQVRRVLAFHGIDLKWSDDFYLLTNGRMRIGTEFGRLLHRDRKFKAALNTMLDVMSEPFVRLFGDVPNLRAIAMAGKE